MKKLYTFKIVLVLCIGLVLSLCLAQEEYAQRTPNKVCTAWVEKCLTDFQSIKPGMTRGAIQKKFPMDGGISSISLTRFTHPECDYFKIDVEFDLKRDVKDPNQPLGSPEDKVTSTSKPYIERPVGD
ncbi:MAG: hypothetical protein ABSG82_05670 [Sedimentisphaerales bacterium]|jgi:hypothetical protein